MRAPSRLPRLVSVAISASVKTSMYRPGGCGARGIRSIGFRSTFPQSTAHRYMDASAALARFWERGGKMVMTWRMFSDVSVSSVFSG